MGKKEVVKKDEIKIGTDCILTKVWIKKGKTSGVPVGVRVITLGKTPAVGEKLYGKNKTEHPSGDPKEVIFCASSTILGINYIPKVGATIETETSILLLQKKPIL